MTYTVKETAEILKISRATLYRIIKTGALTPSRVGGMMRFAEDDIKLYLEQSKGYNSNNKSGEV